MNKRPPPYLYQKMALAMQDYERGLSQQREVRRRQAFEAMCNAIRIQNNERRRVLAEMEQMGLLERRGQRTIRIRGRL